MPPIKGRRADVHARSTPGARPNSIGVPPKDLGEMLDRLDAKSAEQNAAIKRTHARWPFRQASLRLVLEHPGGSTAEVLVACRNLSRGGAGLLHSAFVHVGTRCTLSVPRLNGGSDDYPGAIARCAHLSGKVHELGVRFESPVRLSDHVQVDPLVGGASFEKVDPTRLSGSALAVVAGDIDERLLRHFLGDTRVSARFARSAAEALEERAAPPDVLLLDLSVVDVPEIIEGFRSRGVDSPIVAIAETAGAIIHQQARAIDATALLFKPLSCDLLLSALAECLLVDAANTLVPEVGGATPAAIIESCVQLVRSLGAELRKAMVDDDPMRCFALCQQIRTGAVQLALKELQNAADAAAARIAAAMSVAEALQELDGLSDTCRRVKPPRRSAA